MYLDLKKIIKFFTKLYFLIFIVTLPYKQCLTAELHIGVASNFLMPMNAIKQTFESENNTKIFLSSGSSGSLYSQIINGAPLDIFLSADQVLPKKLENTNKGIKGTRFTYATGKLLLFSTNKDLFNLTFPNIIFSKKNKIYWFRQSKICALWHGCKGSIKISEDFKNIRKKICFK